MVINSLPKSFKINPEILRSYDIRGIVGKHFDASHAYLIGQGYGTLLKEEGGHSIVVGYDGRLTSPELEKALVEGLLSTGLHIIRVGLGPSPLVYFAHYYLNSDASIMVTGSHNPASHNGFKMMLFKKPFYNEQIQALGKIIQKGSFYYARGIQEYVDVKSAYLNYLKTDFLKYYPAARSLKVVWDAANGAVGDILQDLVLNLPGEHILLNEKIDGTFPAHHPDPAVKENLAELIESVKNHQADLGFSFDGDGDRVGVVDDQGYIVWSDHLLILLAEEILKSHPKATIIADTKASDTVFDSIKKLGGIPLMWKTGHSMIKTKMAETGAKLAGEMSGHLFFADRHYGFDDALYAAVRTLGIMATKNESLSAWYQRLPKLISTPEIRLDDLKYDKFLIIADVQQTLKNQNIEFNDLDGIRITNEHGWWALRASNTSETLSIRLESKTEEGLDMLKKQLKGYLQKFDLADKI